MSHNMAAASEWVMREREREKGDWGNKMEAKVVSDLISEVTYHHFYYVLWSRGSHRAGHDWSDLAAAAIGQTDQPCCSVGGDCTMIETRSLGAIAEAGYHIALRVSAGNLCWKILLYLLLCHAKRCFVWKRQNKFSILSFSLPLFKIRSWFPSIHLSDQ